MKSKFIFKLLFIFLFEILVLELNAASYLGFNCKNYYNNFISQYDLSGLVDFNYNLSLVEGLKNRDENLNQDTIPKDIPKDDQKLDVNTPSKQEINTTTESDSGKKKQQTESKEKKDPKAPTEKREKGRNGSSTPKKTEEKSDSKSQDIFTTLKNIEESINSVKSELSKITSYSKGETNIRSEDSWSKELILILIVIFIQVIFFLFGFLYFLTLKNSLSQLRTIVENQLRTRLNSSQYGMISRSEAEATIGRIVENHLRTSLNNLQNTIINNISERITAIIGRSNQQISNQPEPQQQPRFQEIRYTFRGYLKGLQGSVFTILDRDNSDGSYFYLEQDNNGNLYFNFINDKANHAIAQRVFNDNIAIISNGNYLNARRVIVRNRGRVIRNNNHYQVIDRIVIELVQ